MEITKYRHSCLHVRDGAASILLDPGGFSSDLSGLTGLTAVLITHGHADHLNLATLRTVLANNPDADVYADTATTDVLAADGIHARAVRAGDALDVGTSVSVLGRDHAVVHADIPIVPNVCYLIGGTLLHPGDSLTVPDEPVRVLALPVAAPWMAVKEAVDYLRAVAPATWIPIHEAMLAAPDFTYGIVGRLAPAGSSMLDLDDGRTATV